MQKVREKFEVLQPKEITLTSQYVTQSGTFCFNGIVADICADVRNKKLDEFQTLNTTIPSVLRNEVYEQTDTLSIIDHVHSNLIDGHIDFEDAKEQVLDALGNDGENNYDRWAEEHTFSDEDSDYYDDDD